MFPPYINSLLSNKSKPHTPTHTHEKERSASGIDCIGSSLAGLLLPTVTLSMQTKKKKKKKRERPRRRLNTSMFARVSAGILLTSIFLNTQKKT